MLVAVISSCVISFSKAEWPEKGAITKEASGHRSESSKAVPAGQTMSYLPWTIIVGIDLIFSTSS